MDYTTKQQKILDMLLTEEKISKPFLFKRETLNELYVLRQDPATWGLIGSMLDQQGIRSLHLERIIEENHRYRNGDTPHHFPIPQSAETLLGKQFDPLEYYVEEILHEGLTLLAGKPKKGKSYLALDMSLSIAVGRLAFRHFPTQQKRVLYVSLEDGERRLQARLHKIQPNLATPQGLDFLYAFPRLGDGAIEALDHFSQQYQVIIIDVVGRILPTVSSVRKNVSEYQEYTELFGQMQALANENHTALILIDHVRKAGAEDVYDTIMGSQGKWGTADTGLVYERKGEEKDAVLHVAGREVEEQKFVISLMEGHLTFLGKGEAYELDSEQNRIIKVLEEERRPIGAQELMKAMGIHEQHYARFRQVLQRLYDADRIGRTKRGQYTLYGHDRVYADDLDF